MKQLFTIREAAEITGTSKSTIRRYLEALQKFGAIPAGGIVHEKRAGHTVILLSEDTLNALKVAMPDSSTNQGTVYGTNHNAHQDAPDAPESDPRTAELLSELRARIAAQEREISVKNEQITSLTAALETAQQATAAAQALHAATAEQLRRLTAQAAPEPPQDRAEPEPPTDTTTAADEAQEAASAPTEAPAPEITGSGQEAPPERATLSQRLRFLFTGRNSP